MEECPGPESEQEQLACGSSRGEQQFGSVWFHGWKHLQVRNPLFPCLLCETLHCAICDTHACSQTRLGTPLPSVSLALFNGRDCVFCEAFLRDLLWDLAFRETLASVRPCLLWDPGFCEALPSVRPFLLWDPAFVHNVGPSVRPCFLWGLAFCEALPSVMPCLLWELGLSSFNMWHLVFCETMPCVSPCYEWHTLLSVRPCPLWDLAFCETLASVRPCLLWDPGFCEALPSVRLFLLWETLTLLCLFMFYFMMPCLLWDPAFV